MDGGKEAHASSIDDDDDYLKGREGRRTGRETAGKRGGIVATGRHARGEDKKRKGGRLAKHDAV